MDRKNSQSISLCTQCCHTGQVCTASVDFGSVLSNSAERARGLVGDAFSASGFVELGGCVRPCTAGWHIDQTGTYMFGDVSSNDDLTDLIQLAQTMAFPAQTTSTLNKPVAVPAFMLVISEDQAQRNAA